MLLKRASLQLFFLTVFAGLFTFSASASANIECRAVDGRSGEISMNVGRLDVLSVLSARVTAFGRTWSTTEGEGTTIIVGQAFQDDKRMLVDFTDDSVDVVLISLRTVRVSTADEYGEAGILRIGKAVYPVLCEGD
ncbi:hypothetical protein [Ahrensia kielensis]|uniref:hypothetical protein n=1 Tax=Ahrensia kielensis TaxID=76980 RepID=UPI000366E83D|nr:hypothetical protein [Ahrensia kielensis]